MFNIYFIATKIEKNLKKKNSIFFNDNYKRKRRKKKKVKSGAVVSCYLSCKSHFTTYS